MSVSSSPRTSWTRIRSRPSSPRTLTPHGMTPGSWPVSWTARTVWGVREWDDTEHTAWGYGLIKVSSRNFKMTRKFTALEANAVTDYLYSPGDTATKVIVAKPAYVYLGFETTADDATKERLITTMPARVTAPESNRNEEDLASREFTCNIFPNTDKELFHRLVSA